MWPFDICGYPKIPPSPPGAAVLGGLPTYAQIAHKGKLGHFSLKKAGKKNVWPKFDPWHFGPGGPALGPKWKSSDFHSFFFYGSVAIRRTQIFWNFWNRQVRTEDMDQNVPKNGPIPAQAKTPIFGPILLCNTAIMGFFWVERTIRTFLNHFGHVLYPYPCPKWIYFSPIPAQAVIPA